MKYMLLFCGTLDEQKEYDNLTDAQKAEQYGKVGEWWTKYGPKIVEGEQLARPSTATTVRFKNGKAVSVTDGPFIESKEVIGGYAVVEVKDLDEALAMTKEWPVSSLVEIRPLLQMPEPSHTH